MVSLTGLLVFSFNPAPSRNRDLQALSKNSGSPTQNSDIRGHMPPTIVHGNQRGRGKTINPSPRPRANSASAISDRIPLTVPEEIESEETGNRFSLIEGVPDPFTTSGAVASTVNLVSGPYQGLQPTSHEQAVLPSDLLQANPALSQLWALAYPNQISQNPFTTRPPFQTFRPMQISPVVPSHPLGQEIMATPTPYHQEQTFRPVQFPQVPSHPCGQEIMATPTPYHQEVPTPDTEEQKPVPTVVLPPPFYGPMTPERLLQPEIMAFANIAKDQMPPQWGVMKIENVRRYSSPAINLIAFAVLKLCN
jgi:hypothetical protein